MNPEGPIRVGIVGYGACRFGAAFGFQDHPNVEVVAVSDLFPDRFFPGQNRQGTVAAGIDSFGYSTFLDRRTGSNL